MFEFPIHIRLWVLGVYRVIIKKEISPRVGMGLKSLEKGRKIVGKKNL